MVEINLLPEEAKKKKRPASRMNTSAIKLPSLPVIGLAAAAVGVVLAAQLALLITGFMKDATLKSLGSEYKIVSLKKRETEKLKIQMDTMNKRVAAIDELMVKRFSWGKKLDSLSDSVTPGIWFTELEYDEKLTDAPNIADTDSTKNRPGESKQTAEKILSKYLILSGAAYSKGEEGAALVGRFIKSLKDNPEFYSDFSDIELGTIKTDRVDGQDITMFRITCLLKVK